MLYEYCPFCGVKYNSKNKKDDADYPNSLKCSACQKIFYNNPKPAVAGLLLQEEKILLVKRKYNPYKGYWDLPGGFVEYGENLEMTIKREIKEELNLDISVLGIKNTFNLYYPISNSDNLSLIIIVCKIECKRMDTINPNDDVEEYSFFDKKSCPENIAFPEQKKYLEKLFNE